MNVIMTNNASDTRIRKVKGSATVPVIWHLQREGGRDFTIGVYPGICESWNVAKNQWVRIASGFLAEIKERIAPQPAGAKAGPRPYNSTGDYLLYATRDEAHTLALRRVYTIVAACDNA